jgi:hypothetical protein
MLAWPATADQEAVDDYKNTGHGLFTYILADRLSGQGNLLKKGIVTDDELAIYVRQNVSDASNQKQIPVADLNGAPFGVTQVK